MGGRGNLGEKNSALVEGGREVIGCNLPIKYKFANNAMMKKKNDTED